MTAAPAAEGSSIASPRGPLRRVASFSDTLPSIAYFPNFGLTALPGGGLLGLTVLGGALNSGVVFRVPLPGTGFDVVHDFGQPPGVANPAGELVQAADGTLWGTAGGGSAGLGTVYRLSGGPLVAHEFSGTDGASPGNLFAASDGTFYGVTASQGSGGSGTIFQLDGSGNAHDAPRLLRTRRCRPGGRAHAGERWKLLRHDGVRRRRRRRHPVSADELGHAHETSRLHGERDRRAASWPAHPGL